jgi:phosphoribosyl 1,2-cyclic phosphodiesterase
MSEAELQYKIKAALLGAVGIDLTNPEAVNRYVERLPPDICSTAGGNTSCVEMRAGDAVFILDCGSGIRPLGNVLLREAFGKGKGEAHIFITHTHWDHVQGFPFFNPAFIPGNRLNFYSPYPDLQMRFEDQQREIYFPVSLDYMRSTRTWRVLDPKRSSR